jgi:hypothetical protein
MQQRLVGMGMVFGHAAVPDGQTVADYSAAADSSIAQVATPDVGCANLCDHHEACRAANLPSAVGHPQDPISVMSGTHVLFNHDRRCCPLNQRGWYARLQMPSLVHPRIYNGATCWLLGFRTTALRTAINV